MVSLLAQQLPVTELTASVLNIIVALLAVGFLIKNLLKKDSPLPQPMRTQREAEYVPRHEFNELKGDHRTLAARVESLHGELLHAGEQRAIKLHERLNLLIEATAEIRGRSEALTEALTERDPVTRKPRARQ